MSEPGPPEGTSDPPATGGPGSLGEPEAHSDDPGDVALEPADGAPLPVVPGTVARPGLSTFNLEHRVAPGLYLAGWLACLVGLGLLIVSVLSAASTIRSVLLVIALLFLSVGLIAAAGQQALERRAHAWRGYAGPSPFLVFGAAVPCSLLLALFEGFVFSLVGVGFDSPAGIVAGSLATAIPFIWLVRMLVLGTGALTAADLGFARRGAQILRDAGAGAAWGIVVVFGTGLLALALRSLLPTPPGPLPLPTSAGERVADLLVAVVIAPVSEEIFFRGFATTAWARTMSRGRAIVRSGLFFAFIHVLTLSGATSFEQGLGFAAFAFLGRIPVSLALAAAFLRRGSIYESLALHSTFNAVPLLFVFLATG